MPGHHREQPRLLGRVHVFCRADEEAGTNLREPANIVTAAHLIFEEAREHEALRARGLHEVMILRHHGVHHEVIEHRGERRRRRHLQFGGRRDLRVVSQNARVVEQFLTIHARIGDVLQTRDEELERATLIDGE